MSSAPWGESGPKTTPLEKEIFLDLQNSLMWENKFKLRCAPKESFACCEAIRRVSISALTLLYQETSPAHHLKLVNRACTEHQMHCPQFGLGVRENVGTS